ncbi:MAG: hypothetical protein KBS63_01450 [Clostridiales bacterium]|nr:hypothetical protein [Candidatus Crickella caballi]
MKKILSIVLLAGLMLMMLTACEGEKAFIGKWTINEISAGDITMTSEDIRDMGLDAGFVKMQKSGKAVINLLGDESEGTWEMNEDGTGVVISYGDDQTGNVTLEEKELTFVDSQGSVYKATRF